MKKNKLFKILAVVLVVITTALITRFLTVQTLLGSGTNYTKMVFLEKYVRENFLYNKNIKDEDFETGKLKGLVAGLNDPYSQYLTKEELNSLNEQTSGRFHGIGVLISPAEDGTVTVISPLKGSPAERAGLEAGDKILKIDGEDFSSEKINEASKAIRGKVGTEVNLLILKKDTNETKEIKVKREEVKMDSIISDKIGEYGYIGIIMFDEETGKDFETELNKLTLENVKGIILDLRGNPGGVIDGAVQIGDAILPESTFVTLKNNKDEIVEEYKLGSKYNNINMVVLVNEGSASASEILSGAIKDLKRAPIVGQKTFGKGIVQTVSKLPGGDGIKLTTAEYFTPSGKSIHKLGIEPDYKVEIPKDVKGIGIEYQDTDTQLQKALQILKENAGNKAE